MKIVPYSPSDKDKKLMVQLVPCETGDADSVGNSVDLVFVDEDGDHEDAILNLSPSGISLYPDVSTIYGLPLGANACVKVRKGVAGDNDTGAEEEDIGDVRAALSNIKLRITSDGGYRGSTTLDNCDESDTEEVTVGELRMIVAALEKRL